MTIKLTKGVRYSDQSACEALCGWTDNADGYSVLDYFGADGEYLGPDDDGVEPLFSREVLTADERAELVAAIEAANLCCPEQVCDAVLAIAESDGIEAARAELAKAVANDATESRACQ